MPTPSLLVPLVGGFFRPPAKQIMSVLPSDTPLVLVPEPENPYDQHAIQVWIVPRDHIPGDLHQDLHFRLEGTGFDLEEVLAEDFQVQLGFVGATGGKPCRRLSLPGNIELLEFIHGKEISEFNATLQFHETGETLVRVWA